MRKIGQHLRHSREAKPEQVQQFLFKSRRAFMNKLAIKVPCVLSILNDSKTSAKLKTLCYTIS